MSGSVSVQAFTSALALAANSVTVVTTDGAAGRAGLTVSSMCSVCAEPALVLACVSLDNEFCPAVQTHQRFAINLLSVKQADIAMEFAGLGADPTADRFATGNWATGELGQPLLSDALVTLECLLEESSDHGTHRIHIGRVMGVSSQDDTPLVYMRRQFARADSLT